MPGTETNKKKTRNEGNKKRNTRALPYYYVPKRHKPSTRGYFQSASQTFTNCSSVILNGNSIIIGKRHTN